jgi:hypothetical protein
MLEYLGYLVRPRELLVDSSSLSPMGRSENLITYLDSQVVLSVLVVDDGVHPGCTLRVKLLYRGWS